MWRDWVPLYAHPSSSSHGSVSFRGKLRSRQTPDYQKLYQAAEIRSRSAAMRWTWMTRRRASETFLIDVVGRAQKVANLVEGAAEAMSRIEILEAAHRPVASFYASVILFHHVVFVLTGAVVDARAKFVGDSLGIAGMAVGGDLLGLDLGDRLGGAEEGLGGGHIAGLAQVNIDQVAVAVDRPVEIAPLPSDLDVGFIDVPAAADLAGPPLAQTLGEPRRQLGLPVPHRLVGEHEAADQEHLCQIPQAQLVTQSPEDHEKHDVGRDLDPVQRRTSSLVEPPPATPAPEPPEAMDCSALPLGGRRRVAMRAVHGGSLDRSKRAREPIRWGRSRQAAPRSDRTRCPGKRASPPPCEGSAEIESTARPCS